MSKFTDQLPGLLAEAFHAAYLFTRCARRTEEVICLAIERTDIPRVSPRDLLAEVVRLSAIGLGDVALQRRRELPAYAGKELDAVLHLERWPRSLLLPGCFLDFHS